MANAQDKKPQPDAHFSSDPFADENPYQVLGLDRNADRGRIKSAYRAMQKKAKRGDYLWMKAQVANEALTKPKKRLAVDLFTVYEARLYDEIVQRFAEVDFELIPEDLTPLLMQVSDLEWGRLDRDFEVPPTPKVVFESMMPAPPKDDEIVVPDRKK